MRYRAIHVLQLETPDRSRLMARGGVYRWSPPLAVGDNLQHTPSAPAAACKSSTRSMPPCSPWLVYRAWLDPCQAVAQTL